MPGKKVVLVVEVPMHFQLLILEMHLQNCKYKKKIVDFDKFCKCISINFGNSLSILRNINLKKVFLQFIKIIKVYQSLLVKENETGNMYFQEKITKQERKL